MITHILRTWGIHATYGIFGENIPNLAFYSNNHYNHLMGDQASSLVAIDNLKYPIYAYISILHGRKAHNALLYALLDFWSIVTDFKRKKQSQSCTPVQILNATVCYDFVKPRALSGLKYLDTYDYRLTIWYISKFIYSGSSLRKAINVSNIC